MAELKLQFEVDSDESSLDCPEEGVVDTQSSSYNKYTVEQLTNNSGVRK